MSSYILSYLIALLLSYPILSYLIFYGSISTYILCYLLLSDAKCYLILSYLK